MKFVIGRNGTKKETTCDAQQEIRSGCFPEKEIGFFCCRKISATDDYANEKREKESGRLQMWSSAFTY